MKQAVGCIVYWKTSQGREYLMLKKCDDDCQPYWQFITGSVEKNDHDIKQAALRELKEETSIRWFDLRTFHDFIYDYLFEKQIDHSFELCHMQVLAFEAFKFVDVKLCEEHSQYYWMPFPEAMEKIKYTNCKNTLAKLEDYLEAVKIEEKENINI